VSAVPINTTRPIFPKFASDIPLSPSKPLVFSLPEQLFFSIENYMKTSFGRNWIRIDGETCSNITTGREQPGNEDLDDFYNYCSASVVLFRSKRYVEGRRALSQACGLVQSIIKAESPQTLEYLLHVFIVFIQGNVPEVLVLMRKYISSVARLCLDAQHPWAQILQLIGTIDPQCFEDIVLQCWECMMGMYTQGLGQNHVISLSSEINMIKFTLTGQNLPLAEERLRDIQLRSIDATGPGSQSSFGALSTLWRNLSAQSKYAEAETILLEFLRSPQELEFREYQVLGLSYLARAQYEQAKINLAKRSVVGAEQLLRSHFPPSHPWALRELLVLQSLWQEWGFEPEEAVELGKEIEFRMQHGKFDEDDDV
jgi:hypothetical protein